MAVIRYLVNDVDEALPFYRALGFKLADRWGPPFAVLKGHRSTLWLSGPGTSARKTLRNRQKPEPGGWNRVVIEVEDINTTAERLKAIRCQVSLLAHQRAWRAADASRRSVRQPR
jgi:catechol 2,3-dioxygenase-like lactoylglutathione lyase family enzyme